MKFLDSEVGLFRGTDEYYSRLRDGELLPSQGIRVYGGGFSGDERMLSVGFGGVLYFDGEKVLPEDVLSFPEGWGFDGFSFSSLPDSEILDLIKDIEHDNF